MDSRLLSVPLFNWVFELLSFCGVKEIKHMSVLLERTHTLPTTPGHEVKAPHRTGT